MNKTKSLSITQKRIKKFKSIKRGYYSFIILISFYALSFLNPIIVNNKALIVKYNNEYYFPAFKDLVDDFIPIKYYQGTDFGQTEVFGNPLQGEPHYRQLKKQFNNTDNWLIMPLYPYSPIENLLSELKSEPPTEPDKFNFFGTDNRGRDVFARLIYGFQISMSFALLVTTLSYIIGIILGATLGFFGGKIDIYGQRIIEIFMAMPFLFLMMILVSFTQPSFILLGSMLVILSGWISITFYIRSEFYREKSKDYVAAAVSMGASNFQVMFKHILPNALTPIITFAPFAIIGYISSLVSLDFLGFGLAPPTPSWGELIKQGTQDIRYWWLIVSPLTAMAFTLFAITFIGEAIREAFDPKVYSRLR